MKNALHALVIDDEPQIRGFICEVLRDDGWEISEAASAGQALEMLNKRDWSVVFCDVLLGDADGFSVLKRFKEESPETQVMLMTGHGTAIGALGHGLRRLRLPAETFRRGRTAVSSASPA